MPDISDSSVISEVLARTIFDALRGSSAEGEDQDGDLVVLYTGECTLDGSSVKVAVEDEWGYRINSFDITVTPRFPL